MGVVIGCVLFLGEGFGTGDFCCLFVLQFLVVCSCCFFQRGVVGCCLCVCVCVCVMVLLILFALFFSDGYC